MTTEQLMLLLQAGAGIFRLIEDHRVAARQAAQSNPELLALLDALDADYDKRIKAREQG